MVVGILIHRHGFAAARGGWCKELMFHISFLVFFSFYKLILLKHRLWYYTKGQLKN